MGSMARIVPSELAPSEAVHYTFGEAEFDLGGKSDKAAFETTDRELLTNALAHPWLHVEFDEAEQLGGEFIDNQVHAEDDPFSAVGPGANDAFDPEKIKAAEEAKGTLVDRVALNAGLDQDEPVFHGSVAVTVAADDEHEPAKSASNFDQPDAGSTKDNK